VRWVFILLALLVVQAMAQDAIGPGSLIPIGPNTNNTAAPPPPPPGGCTGALDMSTGCAQLIAFGVLF
jgi:hypothetical protein